MSLTISWNHFFLLKLQKKLRCKFMLLRSIMGIAQIFTNPLSRIFQKRLEHKNQTKYYRRITRKPQSHFKILIYRTWVIVYRGIYCTHVISSVSQGGVNRDVIISPHVWIARRTNRDQLYLSIPARSWSFRRGVRFEIESQMRTKHFQEEKEKLSKNTSISKHVSFQGSN